MTVGDWPYPNMPRIAPRELLDGDFDGGRFVADPGFIGAPGEIQGTLMVGDIDVESTLRKLLKQQTEQDVIVKCKACGQWAAVKTPCVHCGSPVDPPDYEEELPRFDYGNKPVRGYLAST